METKVYYGEYSLEYWIKILLSRDIELPPYQRSFVWEEDQVKRLIDSIQEGQFVPPITIGGFYNEKNQLVNYIIDGQQRLTSILIAYLQLFPNREVFADRQETIADSEILPADSQENDIPKPLAWTLRELQNKGRTRQEIVEACNISEYIPFSADERFIDVNFLKSHFLGFSYIVPKNSSKNDQQRFYSKLFRDINIQGRKLKAQESRRSLYFMRDEYESFFEPDFMKKYYLLIGKSHLTIDFVRYISFTTNYNHSHSVSNVARTYWKDYEPYYERYVYAVVQDENDQMFGKFSDLFPTEERKNQVMKDLQQTLLNLQIPNEYRNYISMDMYLFGLVYYVVVKHKHINTNRALDLRKELNSRIAEYEHDDYHSWAPNMISKIRQRLHESVAIYGKYVYE